MKKTLLGLILAASLVACDNAANNDGDAKDSLDSIANAKKAAIDSAAEEKKERIDSTTEQKKEVLDRLDSLDKKDSVNR